MIAAIGAFHSLIRLEGTLLLIIVALTTPEIRVAGIVSLDGLHCLVHGGLEHVVLRSKGSISW